MADAMKSRGEREKCTGEELFERERNLVIVIGTSPNEADEVGQSCLSSLHHGLNLFKAICSGALLVFCIIILMTGNQNGKLIAGPGAVIIFWLLILYLGCLEGGQNAIVGLQPLVPHLYQTTHPLTARIIRLTQGGSSSETDTTAVPTLTVIPSPGDDDESSGKLEKFLMGRQLITVIVIFGLNGVGAIHEGCSTLFALPTPVTAIFCSSGVALIIITILLGQVTGQIISTRYMLDYLNNSLVLVTVYASIAIEISGLLHAVHFVSGAIELLIGGATPNSSSSSSPSKGRDLQSEILYWGRVGFSFLCLG
jgi:hypothetical protein